MPTQPLLGAMVGGWEIILIFVTLLLLGGGAAAVAALIYFVVRASQRKHGSPPPPPVPPIPPVPRPDIEQELRTLTKLKQDGLITEDEFNAKKKALLGL